MSCKHPLKAWPIGVTDAGKTDYKITSFSVHHLEKRKGIWYAVTEDYMSPYRERSVTEFVQIPCGKCIGCRLEYSKQWANRLMLEAQYHEESYFITLTYDNDHVPLSYYSDPETGEAMQSMTLRKRDFQLFMKRLRRWQDGSRENYNDLSAEYKESNNSLRYFVAGEYGSKTLRPHYHAIIFNLHLDDLVFYKYNELKQPYFTSEKLSSLWYSEDDYRAMISQKKVRGVLSPLKPQGFVVVAPVTWETCAYTARYTAKKNNTQGDEFFETFNMEPPFTLMSRRPGIAREYYDDHPDLMKYSFMNLRLPDGGKKISIPKYFQKLYDVEYPEESAQLKEMRKRLADQTAKLKLAATDLSYEDYLQVEENNLMNRIKTLKRSAV